MSYYKIVEIVNKTETRIRNEFGVSCRLYMDILIDKEIMDRVMEILEVWGVDENVILRQSRSAELVTMRYIIILYMRRICKMKLEKIAEYFRFKHHSSVIDALQAVDRHLETNDALFMRYYKPVNHLLR